MDRTGGCDNNYTYLTRSDVRKKYGCTDKKRCAECEERTTCTRIAAGKYRSFYNGRKTILESKYFCETANGICKLNKCKVYNVCCKKEKKKYEAWKHAYHNDKKKEIMRLTEG